MKRITIALVTLLAAAGASARQAAHDHGAHTHPVTTTQARAANISLPADSLYQLDTALTDASGRRFTLKDLAGRPLLATMFYGDCHTACPVIIETLKRTVAALGADGKRLRILLVSLDPKRDTPQSLSMLAQMHKIDRAQFRLAVAGSDSDTRTLASALNIRYRALDNGEISHTTRIALLTPTGTVAADSTRLSTEPDTAFVRQVAALLKAQKDKPDQEIAR